jgi:hypothetical protein
MKISMMLENALQYITEGFARIFSPAEEVSPSEAKPPEIGVQPYDCNLYYE